MHEYKIKVKNADIDLFEKLMEKLNIEYSLTTSQTKINTLKKYQVCDKQRKMATDSRHNSLKEVIDKIDDLRKDNTDVQK